MPPPASLVPSPGSFEIRVEPRLALEGPSLSPRRRGVPRLRISLTSALIVAGLAVLAQRSSEMAENRVEEPSAGPQPAAPPSPWQTIPGPMAVYELEGPEWNRLGLAYEARRHEMGAREDTLLLGRFASEAAHLRLAITRGARAEAARSLFVDLARRAAAAGMAVTRVAQSAPAATKLGPVEAAEIVLGSSAPRSCLGFRFIHADLAFRLDGWLCGAGGQAPDAEQLACTLDRLSPIEATDDPSLRALFARARARAGAPRACLPGGGTPSPKTAGRT